MKLMEPFRIKNLDLRNRIVMPGMETNLGDEEGNLSPKAVRYYEERAKGGVGLIIVEGAYFDKRGSGTERMLSIERDRKIRQFAGLTKTIKRHGARALLQIYHAGSQASSFMIGLKPVAPSDVPFQMSGEVPVPLSKREIKKIVKGYGRACLRAKRAGFDGVEIHAGHGYLLNQFFSPLNNKRADEYGGSFENRTRIHIAILRTVRKKCGEDFLIGFRMNGRDYIDGGIEVGETVRLARKLEEQGADLINITGGVFDSPGFPVVPYMSYPRGVFSDAAAAVKRALSRTAVCVVGRINTPDTAEQILQEGKADLVAIGRGLIADPCFPRKVMEGQTEEIRYCIGCNACLDQIMTDQPVACSVNPGLLGPGEDCRQEEERRSEGDSLPEEEGRLEEGRGRAGRSRPSEVSGAAETWQRVLIVGAGIAGLEAARTAASRGHEVLLIEKQGQVGGGTHLAGAAPMKRELRLLLPYYEHILRKQGITLRLNTPFDSRILNAFKPDAVILATGSVPEETYIKGLEGVPNSLYPEVLGGNIPAGKKIIVLGGGMIGLEAAEYLLSRDKDVTIVEETGRLGADHYVLVAREVINLLKVNPRLTVLLEARGEEIKDRRLVVNSRGERTEVEFDHLVIAMGRVPYRPIEEELRSRVKAVYHIGDCRKPGMILDAVSGAYRIVMALGGDREDDLGPEIAEEGSGGQGESPREDPRVRIACRIKRGDFALEDIPDYLTVLVKTCNQNPKIRKKSGKAVLEFQFNLIGGTNYWIRIDRGLFSTGSGNLDKPSVTIQMKADIAPGIFSGGVNAAGAYLAKELAFIGPMKHGIAFRNWVNMVKRDLGI